MDCNPPGSSVRRDSPGKNTGMGCHALLQRIFPTPRIKPRSPTLQADSLPAELQGKSKNTGVGRLSLLQWIFLTQELNWGLLHCRCILYQLSYEGNPPIHTHIHTVNVAQLCLTLCDPMDCSPWNCSGQNIGMGSFSFLQGIFPTQGSNPGFLHCRRILYQLSHKGSPRILEWVGYPFSSGSS